MRKGESAPHRKAAENVCGAEKRKCTAQEGHRGSVRCRKGKVHRTGKLQRMCAVRKSESAPHRKVVEDVYGAKR